MIVEKAQHKNSNPEGVKGFYAGHIFTSLHSDRFHGKRPRKPHGQAMAR